MTQEPMQDQPISLVENILESMFDDGNGNSTCVISKMSMEEILTSNLTPLSNHIAEMKTKWENITQQNFSETYIGMHARNNLLQDLTTLESLLTSPTK